MRSTWRHERNLQVYPCAAMPGVTGGLGSAELAGQGYLMRAAVRPDRQSERRERGSLRPRERRLLFPEGRVAIRQGDHVYFPLDSRCWRVMQRRDYPGHLEIEVEVEG
ncbi:MAG: hypothetical protein AB9880_08335 [Christensenellales bacterium]